MSIELDVIERLLRPEDNHEDDLMIDPVRVQQILINLIQNAIKFSERRGSVVVGFSTTETNDMPQTVSATISVRDQGIGINEEDMGNLF